MASEASGSNGFTLHCRGEVRLYQAGTDCTPRAKKGRALIAILAAEQRPLSRVKIIDLLWSDRAEEQARASLRTLLADMKEQFGDGFDDLLVVERERIALGPAVRSDLADPTLARPAGELFEGLDHLDPELDDWLRIERERWGEAATRPPAPGPLLASAAGPSRRPLLIALLVAALALIGLFSWQRGAAVRDPVIAVLKFKDVSGRNPQLADGLAEQLRIELEQRPGLRVIAATSSESPTVAKADAVEKARLLDATHLVEGVIVPHDGALQLSLRLVDPKQPRALWSTIVPANGPALLLGKDPVAPQIAAVLGEVASNPLDRRGLAADDRAYADYFRAVALTHDEERAKLEQARALLAGVLKRFPDFAPALAQSARLAMRLSDQTLLGIGTTPVAEARVEARRLASRAIAVAPHYAPAYSARGLADIGLESGLDYYREAVRLAPGSSGAQADWYYAMGMLKLGDAEARLKPLRLAARLDPINGQLQYALVEAEMLAGHPDEGRAVLQRYVARDVPPDRRHETVSQTELIMFGDWSNAYVEAMLAKRANPANAQADYLLMWSKLLLYGPAAALPHAKPGSMTQMILRDDLAALTRHVDGLGKEFWSSNYEIMAAGHYLNARGRSDVILRSMDRLRGEGAPLRMFGYPDVMAALRDSGRTREADFLIKRARGIFGDFKAEEAARTAHKVAMLQALAGDVDGAIANLQVAHSRNWWGVSDILDHPYAVYALKPLRQDRRFRQLVSDYDAWVENERRQAAARSKELGLPPPPASPPPPFPPIA